MQEIQKFTLGTAVLAGGKSSRMGQNKVLMEYQNRRFLDRICEELRGFDEKPCISAAMPGEYEDLGLSVVCDEHREIGPMEGIRQVLIHTSCDYVFVCAGDMPFITGDLVRYMAEFISSDYDCYCMVDEDHIHPLCAIYSKKILPVIEELIEQGQYRLMQILRRVRTKYIRLESSCFDKKQLRNINTREEYESLSLPLIFCVSGVKDSGKTGLIIKLINEFIRDGYRVGVIKHDGHEYAMDQEGLKDSAYPKVEVVRRAVSEHKVCATEHLIAVATDVVTQDAVNCPVYDMNDIAGIYACILGYFGISGRLR